MSRDPAPWLDPQSDRERTMAETIEALDSDRASHRRALVRVRDLLTGSLDTDRDPRATVRLVIADLDRELR